MQEPIEKKRKTQESYLVFGGNGWIGGKLIELLQNQDAHFNVARARMEDREHVQKELDDCKPTHVLLAAGVTGSPTVDWCEDNKQQTIRSNIIGTLNVIDCCWQRQIHVTNFATGCIFEYDQNHPVGGPGFTESDTPNFTGSFYSKTKVPRFIFCCVQYNTNSRQWLTRCFVSIVIA